MKILITNRVLIGRSGTEVVVGDIARALKRAGHHPSIYSPMVGETADLIRDSGVPVYSDFAHVPDTPDVIHGQHHPETLAALLRFPQSRAVFVCHDARAWHDEPLLFPRVLGYVAVDHRCEQRLLRAGVSPERVRIIFNAVDLERHRPRGPLPRKPLRAAIFSNYAASWTHVPAVKQACRKLGIELDVIGKEYGTKAMHPEELLPRYDLVFAKARCALEAMTTGCAVVVCDFAGLGGLVTPENFSELRRLNFGGGTLLRPLNPELIAAEIKKYDAGAANAVSSRAREEADLNRAVMDWVECYQEVLDSRESPCSHADELAAIADYLARWGYGARVAWEKERAEKFIGLPIVGRWIRRVLRKAQLRTWQNT